MTTLSWRIPALVISLVPGLIAQNLPTADEINARAERADIEGTSNLRSYSLLRHYVVDNPRFGKHAEMTVRVTYTPEAGKTFEIVSSTGADGMQKHVFDKLLQAEKESSANRHLEDMRIGPRNYALKLLGTETKDGVNCYVLEMKPVRKGKYLLEGKVWINESDFGVVQVDGRPAERISFWVGRPLISQSFRKVGPVYMMCTNKSVADVKILGRSELTIASSEFHVNEEVAHVAHAKPAATN
jgi:hypothetical protein